jgi:hypothetical protein
MSVEVPEVPALPDFCWPVDTACVDDWDALTDPSDESSDPVYTDAQKARAVALAGQVLRMLTGYRVGGCPITVRPCRAGWHQQTYGARPVGGRYGGSFSTPWVPVSLGGEWLNIGCGCGAVCGCGGLAEVQLLGIVGDVTEVKIDGAVLTSTKYRLDAGGRLVRIDGGRWPTTQDMDAADTEAGTWSVTYTPGAAVDGLGAYAAGVLAGQFVRACSGGRCDLPDTVTQIVRQGITLTLGTGVFPDGKTGIREVDTYIATWNPYGHAVPPLAYSPDLPQHRGIL